MAVNIKRRKISAKCKNCNKSFTYLFYTRNRRFCSKRCVDRDKYLRKKDYYRKKMNKWIKDNPDKKKICNKKALDKFRNNKRDRFNHLMRINYHRNKDKHYSRTITYNLINSKFKIPIICKICGNNENLEIHHEEYSTDRNKVKSLINDGKIYYLCKFHHNKIHNHGLLKL